MRFTKLLETSHNQKTTPQFLFDLFSHLKEFLNFNVGEVWIFNPLESRMEPLGWNNNYTTTTRSFISANEFFKYISKENIENITEPNCVFRKKNEISDQFILSIPLERSGTYYGHVILFSDNEISINNSSSEIMATLSTVILSHHSHLKLDEHNIERWAQLQLKKGFNSEQNWPNKMLEVVKVLVELFPIDLFTFGPLDKERHYPRVGIERVANQEFRVIPLKVFLKNQKIDVEAYERFRTRFKHNGPMVWNLKDILSLPKENVVHKNMHKMFGIKSAMLFPVLSHKNHWYFSLFSKQDNSYCSTYVKRLERIMPSFQLVLDKALHLEEIQELNELLKQEKQYLEEEINEQYNFNEIIGASAIIKDLLDKISLVSNTDTTVLILGETGTGKELVARALHGNSSRQNSPFIKVNCAALPTELIESELLGHEKGSFSGAINQRIGKFELARGGTIFLDEIGELPIALQSKLLRVIQEKEFERIGGHSVIKADVRILAATNRNLGEEMEKGNFRADLFYRLNVFPIEIPPLRERGEDVLLLTQHFLEYYRNKFNRKILKLSEFSKKAISDYHWPGNVRELEHVIQRSVLLNKGDVLDIVVLDYKDKGLENHNSKTKLKTLFDAEKEAIIAALKATNGKIRGKGGAAELLDIPASTLQYRMKRAGIVKESILKIIN